MRKVNEWMNECVNEWMSEWVNEWVSECYEMRLWRRFVEFRRPMNPIRNKEYPRQSADLPIARSKLLHLPICISSKRRKRKQIYYSKVTFSSLSSLPLSLFIVLLMLCEYSKRNIQKSVEEYIGIISPLHPTFTQPLSFNLFEYLQCIIFLCQILCLRFTNNRDQFFVDIQTNREINNHKR
jgi:hypothetical protein